MKVTKKQLEKLVQGAIKEQLDTNRSHSGEGVPLELYNSVLKQIININKEEEFEEVIDEIDFYIASSTGRKNKALKSMKQWIIKAKDALDQTNDYILQARAIAHREIKDS